MQINSSKIVEIYFILDEYSKKYLQIVNAHKVDDGKNHRNKPNKMSDAEVMLILIMFHDGGYKCLKHYYINYICKHCHDLFPTTLSYNRFVELQRSVLIELGYFVKTCLMAECTGISFVDSTPLRVCREQRILQHKVFQGFAQRGKCSMGWFFGFKLHIIINDRGELINFMITPGNVDDRDPLKQQHFVEAITGKLFADRGYIGKELFGELFINGIQLVTKLKKGMKNMLMSQSDKILLRKRSLVESVNDELKNMAQIEHSRHRSIANFLTNAFAAIAAYCYFPKNHHLICNLKTIINSYFSNSLISNSRYFTASFYKQFLISFHSLERLLDMDHSNKSSDFCKIKINKSSKIRENSKKNSKIDIIDSKASTSIEAGAFFLSFC